MTDEQRKATRSFRLLSEKPRVVIFNTADDEPHPERFTALGTGRHPVIAIPAGLELELSKMSPEDRAEFQREMGVGGADRDGLTATCCRPPASGYFSPPARRKSAPGCCPRAGRPWTPRPRSTPIWPAASSAPRS